MSFLSRVDWKFIVMLIAAVAGIAVPVWIWQADQRARGLTVRVVSVSSLQAKESSSLSGLKLTFEGQELKEPNIAVLEVANTGSRPLQLADFESSIEISASAPSQLVRVELSSVTPKDLQPKVGLVGDKITIDPLLLNPADAITVTALISGRDPSFSVRARVAGIAQVKLVDEGRNAQAAIREVVKAVIGALLFLSYGVALMMWGEVFRRFRGSWLLLIVAIVSAAGGMTLLDPTLTRLDLAWWQVGLATLAGASFSIAIASWAIHVNGLQPLRPFSTAAKKLAGHDF